MFRKQSGFSLFELMVVIAITGIMSAIVIPNYIAWRSNSNLRNSAFDLKSDMEMGKSRAIRNGKNVAVVFTGLKCDIFVDTDGDFVKDSGETVLSAREFQNMTVTPNFTGDPDSATGFNSRGQIANIANTNIYKTGSVTLTNGSLTMVVEAQTLGFIKIR